MVSKTRILLVVVAFSGALNVYLLATRSRAGSGAAKRVTKSGHTPRPDCCKGLAQCQRQRYAQALVALRGGPAKRPAPRPHNAATPALAPASGAVGLADQRQALCDVATEHLRRSWTRHPKRLTESLRKGLADDREQERAMVREVERFGDALGLTPADRDRLETHYRPLRKKRFDEALTALQREPPDYKAVHRAARALWQDQDRLVKELFGSDSVGKLRRAELRSRTAVTALVAAQAGLDWEQSLSW